MKSFLKIFVGAICLLVLGVVDPALCNTQTAVTGSPDVVQIMHSNWYMITPPTTFVGYQNELDCSCEKLRDQGQRSDCYKDNSSESLTSIDARFIRETVNRFIYQIKVRNNGESTAKSIGWEYDFIDPDTGQLLQRHQFSSRTILGPGQSVLLSENSLRPPTFVVRADQLGKPDSAIYREEVRIVSIEFEQRP